VPSGPHGVQPSLTLTYSSGGPNGVISEDHSHYERSQGSWTGFGWELSLGYVLMTAFGAGNQRCYLVLNNRSDDLIHTTSDSDGDDYVTQNNAFLWVKNVKFTDSANTDWNYFLVRATDGTEYRFGYESASFANGQYYGATGSRQDGYWLQGINNNTQYNVGWMPVRYNLDQITDTHGNTITVKYASHQGTRQVAGLANANNPVLYDRWVYPSEIDYCSTDAGGPQRKIVFNLGSRTDLPANVDYDQDSLLDSIDAYVAGALVRKYVFAYTYESYSASYPHDNKAQDLILTSLTECDGSATAGAVGGTLSGKALPSTSFQYAISNGWVGDQSYAQFCPIPLLTQVSNGHGGVVQYGYTTTQTTPTGPYTPQGSYTTRYRDNGGVSSAQSQWWAVQTKTVLDGQGNSDLTTYQHGVGSQDGPFAGWSNKLANTQSFTATYPEWRGFNLTAAIDPLDGSQQHKVTEHRFYRGGFSWSGSWTVARSDGATFGDTECLKGLTYETRSFDDQGVWNTFSDGAVPTGKDWTSWTYDPPTAYKPGGLPPGDQEDWSVYVVYQSSTQITRGSSYLYRSFKYDPVSQNGKQYGNLTHIYEYDRTTTAWARLTRRWYYPGDSTGNFNPSSGSPTDQYVVDRVGAENVYAFDPSDPTSDGILVRSTLSLCLILLIGPLRWSGVAHLR